MNTTLSSVAHYDYIAKKQGGNTMNEKVLRVAELTLEINAKTDYCAFFSFSGHVSCFYAQVYASKKAPACPKIYEAFLVSVNNETVIEKTIEDLELLLGEGMKEVNHELGA